jgi:pentatricopeptide repeat protein
MKPTTVSFGAVLQGFARAGDTKRAEAIVEHMEKLMNTDGYGEMRPNTVIYNILINAYARSRTPGAIDNRVLLILDKMKKYGEEGHSDTNPTIITYNASYQHSPQVEAMSFKNWKKQNEVKSQFLPTILPDVTYTTILKILTTSRVPKKTMSIISVMEKDLDNPKLRPNNFTYDAVIKLRGRRSSNDAKL